MMVTKHGYAIAHRGIIMVEHTVTRIRLIKREHPRVNILKYIPAKHLRLLVIVCTYTTLYYYKTRASANFGRTIILQ